MSATLAPAAAPAAASRTPDAAAAPDPLAAPPARERLVSLDVFRGLTVAGMLLVNNPGSWGAIYPPLGHAEWHGWTPTDLIFPFFLFIVGITTELSLGARRARGADDRSVVRQVVRRGALIFLFGLVLSAFPFFQWGSIKDVPDPSFLDRVAYRFEHLRVMGVLQRIGLAYLLAGLVTLRTSWRQQVAIIAAILLGYWALMALAAVPPTGQPGWMVWDQPGTTVDAWLDRVILTPDHLWIGAGGLRDPEGLLSTLPAVASVMLGVLAGRWIGQQRRPLAERLNGLYAGALACVALATCMWLIDVQRVTGWTRPFVVYGTNPMLAFLGSGLMARLIYSIFKVELEGKPVPLVEWAYRQVYAPWLPPRAASLGFALTFVGFWYLVLRWCYRRGIVFRV
jgi:predicted acyltransferase